MLSDDRDRIRLRDCVWRMLEVVRHEAVASISDGVTALTRRSPISIPTTRSTRGCRRT